MDPVTNKAEILSKVQEVTLKDIEWAFGVLQGIYHIIFTTTRFEFVNTMMKVMKCVIIMHNMVVEKRLFKTTAEEE